MPLLSFLPTVCPKAKDAMCDEDKCEYESVRVDKCGCEVRDCTGNPSHQCNSDDDCNDECKNKECKSVVVCEVSRCLFVCKVSTDVLMWCIQLVFLPQYPIAPP